MQMIFIGAALLIGSALGFAAIWFLGKWIIAKADEHEALSYARKVQLEATRREQGMHKYCLSDLRPAKKA
jgi:hypothetical protein